MKKPEGCFLQLKVELKKDNPLYKLKEKFRDAIKEVDIYLHPQKGPDSVVIFLAGSYEVVSKVEKFIETLPNMRIEGRAAYNSKTSRWHLRCWVKSPIFDLVREGKGLLLEHELK